MAVSGTGGAGRTSLAVAGLLLVLVGCSPKSTSSPSAVSRSATAPSISVAGTASGISSATATATATAPVPAPTEAAEVSPGAALPAGQRKGDCPYISTVDAQNTVGSHSYLSTISTDSTVPVSCWFYFYSSPYNAMLTIEPQRFATAIDAHNAMVRLAQTTTDANTIDTYTSFQPGVDLISFLTALVPADHGQNWACTFAKGTTMVLIRTQQNRVSGVSQNARNVASMIVDKF